MYGLGVHQSLLRGAATSRRWDSWKSVLVARLCWIFLLHAGFPCYSRRLLPSEGGSEHAHKSMALDEKNLAGVGPVGARWYFCLGRDRAGRAISVRAAGSDDRGEAGTRTKLALLMQTTTDSESSKVGDRVEFQLARPRDGQKSNRVTCRFSGHRARNESAARGKEQLQTRSCGLENGPDDRAGRDQGGTGVPAPTPQ